jgi:uncharacterized protein with GYD domain
VRRVQTSSQEAKTMPQYLYQCAYTPESLARQIKNPTNRLDVVAEQIRSAGVRILAGGFSFGEADVTIVLEAPDDTTMAAVAIAIGAGGAVRNARTTRLLSGAEFVEALKKAPSVGYRPAQ